MIRYARRFTYKAVLTFVVLSLMLPAPIHAMPIEPPRQPQAIIGLGVVNDSPTELGNTTGFTATVGGFVPITYTWNFGAGTAEVAGPSNLAGYAYSEIGYYTAIVTATD